MYICKYDIPKMVFLIKLYLSKASQLMQPNKTNNKQYSTQQNISSSPAKKNTKQAKVPSPPKPDPVELMKQYFKLEMKQLNTQTLKEVFIDLLESKKFISQQIRKGYVEISQEKTILNDAFLYGKVIPKRVKLNRQINELNKNNFQSQQTFLEQKKKLLDQLHEELKRQRQEQNKKNKEVEEKVKAWSVEHRQMARKRQNLRQKQQQQILRAIEEQKMKEQEQKNESKLQKKKIAEQRLKQLEQNRMRRQEEKKKQKQVSNDKLPLYLELQKRYRQSEDQHKFQAEIAKKNHKISMKIDHQQLKAHSQKFLRSIEERNQKIQESRTQQSSVQPESDFNLFTNRKEEKYIQEREKRKRIKKFQQKISRIPITVDDAKKVQIQIALDKAKNPFKYNFLGQKSLNDFQIFGEFKNFSINTDCKELGNQYLEEVRQKVKDSRIGKSSSLQIVRQAQYQTDRPNYKDYLTQFKMKRSSLENSEAKETEGLNKRYKSTHDVQKIIKQHRDKEMAKKELFKKSEQLQFQALKKKKEAMAESIGYKAMLGKESKMDQAYTTALKARLACLQIRHK